MSNVAIILGAGNGTRMGIDKSKLLLEINGKTVIQRSVETFLSIKDIDRVIVTVRKNDVELFSKILNDKRITFVIGGDTRQQSVKNAVDTIDSCELVIIHDGARPLVTKDTIISTIDNAKKYKAAATGVKVKDTIKVVDDNGYIVDTPNRDSLVAIQTPQIFDFELYKNAMAQAIKDKKDFTDDCKLVENYGEKVKVVIGEYTHIKITTPDDVVVAQQILKKGE